MSIQAREALVAKLNFQAPSQKADLLNPNLTQTGLIALLLELAGKGFFMEMTAVRSDHHDDSALGLHCHANGYCVDLGITKSATPGDWADDGGTIVQDFLKAAAQSPWLYQIGLAGDFWTPANVAAAGSTVYQDDGGPHIHLGAVN